MLIIKRILTFLLKIQTLLSNRSRWAFGLIVLFSLVVPVLDLLFFKIIANVFTADQAHTDVVETVAPLAAVLIVMGFLKYSSNVRKVFYVNRIIEINYEIDQGGVGGNINWLRVIIFETLNSLISIIHVLMISFLGFFISAEMGLVLTFVTLVSLFVVDFFFKSEIINQRKIKNDATTLNYKRAELRVFSRIRSAEQGVVVINIVVLFYFVALIYMYINQMIPAQDALLFLFLTRFVSTNLGGMASSFMRLSRAWVNIEDDFDELETKIFDRCGRKRVKIVFIGLQCTGAAEIQKEVMKLGWRKIGYDLDHIALYRKEMFDQLTDVLYAYDTAINWPWSLLYKELHAKYPDTLFVLTSRVSDQDWLDSMVKQRGRVAWHRGKKRNLEKHGKKSFRAEVYGIDDPLKGQEQYKSFYNRHNQEVREFFKDKSNIFYDLKPDDRAGIDALLKTLKKKKSKGRRFHTIAANNVEAIE